MLSRNYENLTSVDRENIAKLLISQSYANQLLERNKELGVIDGVPPSKSLYSDISDNRKINFINNLNSYYVLLEQIFKHFAPKKRVEGSDKEIDKFNEKINETDTYLEELYMENIEYSDKLTKLYRRGTEYNENEIRELETLITSNENEIDKVREILKQYITERDDTINPKIRFIDKNILPIFYNSVIKVRQLSETLIDSNASIINYLSNNKDIEFVKSVKKTNDKLIKVKNNYFTLFKPKMKDGEIVNLFSNFGVSRANIQTITLEITEMTKTLDNVIKQNTQLINLGMDTDINVLDSRINIELKGSSMDPSYYYDEFNPNVGFIESEFIQPYKYG